jgi:hypothetical protein
MAGLVPAISIRKARSFRNRDARDIGERSDAVLRTATPGHDKKAKAGAAERIRTSDPRITNAVLYQLSYRGALVEWRPSNTG